MFPTLLTQGILESLRLPFATTIETFVCTFALKGVSSFTLEPGTVFQENSQYYTIV